MTTLRLTPSELETLRAARPELVILDVRLPEDYECRHIAGAVNNCVYEVAFHERLPALLPDPSTPVCVYGESGASHEAAMAAEKLRRAGYAQVHRLNGCLAGWCAAGFSTEGSGIMPAASPVPHGRLNLDLQESRVEWLGRNLLNKHWGRVPLASGYLDFDQGKLVGGELVLAMTGLTSEDLAGTPLHDVLVAHLQSDDFFDASRYPEARLEITRAESINDALPGAQNLRIEAELTLRGITAPIAFTASSGIDAQGRAAAQSAFSLDRTRWGVLYGSGRYFHRLAGHLVNDLIELQVRIVTS